MHDAGVVVKVEMPKLVGGIGNNNWGKQYRQGDRVYDADGVAMCLTARPLGNAGGCSYIYKVGYSLRKLTPLECWRLMDFSDEDFYAAMMGNRKAAIETINQYGLRSKRFKTIAEASQKMSNSQLYKQAGNSIVKAVLMAIFKQMI